MKKLTLIFFTALLLIISATVCHAAGPWRGRVIDAETKQPIEGAAVVAVWEKKWMGLGAGSISSFLDASEAVTDKNGNFDIPAKSFLSIPYFRQVRGPFFTMFKPGYGSYPDFQVNIKAPNIIAAEYFQTKGAIVELPKLKSRKERLEQLDLLGMEIGVSPKLLKLYNIESKELGLSEVHIYK